jgi:hypothetical protein
MPLAHLHAPPLAFRIGDRCFDMLVGVAWSAHSMDPLFTFVNTMRSDLTTPFVGRRSRRAALPLLCRSPPPVARTGRPVADGSPLASGQRERREDVRLRKRTSPNVCSAMDNANRVILSGIRGHRSLRKRSQTPSHVRLFAKNEGVGSQQGLAHHVAGPWAFVGLETLRVGDAGRRWAGDGRADKKRDAAPIGGAGQGSRSLLWPAGREDPRAFNGSAASRWTGRRGVNWPPDA